MQKNTHVTLSQTSFVIYMPLSGERYIGAGSEIGGKLALVADQEPVLASFEGRLRMFLPQIPQVSSGEGGN
jgi:hypothetical protein